MTFRLTLGSDGTAVAPVVATSSSPGVAGDITAADLRDYDWIVVNTSGGKDSAVLLDVICKLATEARCLNRVVAVHADLGEVEWDGVKELAERQAARYGVRFEVVKNTTPSANGGDLLDYIERRGMWPDEKNRYCTSDWKRGPISKLLSALVREKIGGATKPTFRVRVLNCLGMRAQESRKRAKLPVLEVERDNGRCKIDRWHPLLGWSKAEIWAHVDANQLEMHEAYAKGMDRLSCQFCVFAPKAALMIAARANPTLARRYAAVEVRIGHTFRKGFSIAATVEEALSTEADTGEMGDWAA